MTRARFDLAVIGSTPAGVALAVRAARQGLKVLLVARDCHLGGMLASGLGVWDTRIEGRRAPIYDEVRRKIVGYYHDRYGEHSQQHRCAQPGREGHTNGCFEPAVAHEVIRQLVTDEPGITVWRKCQVIEVERRGPLVVSFRCRVADDSGLREVEANAFADCTYEGDFAMLAGVPYRVGREARTEFDEPHAGRIFLRPAAASKQTPAKGIPQGLRWHAGRSEIVPVRGSGAADGHVQAFNYRTILTADPSNRRPMSRPLRYDPERYRDAEYDFLIQPLPNRKLSWNRPQLPGRATAYVVGDAATRRRIRDEHWEATLGLLHYLQTDVRVPADVRAAWSERGLAADEFVDGEGRPPELYVREARRIEGRRRLIEQDVLPSPVAPRAPVQPDGIGIIDWYIDVHACGTTRMGGSFLEGKMILAEQSVPGQVPYGAIVPREIDNLLVPVALAATHVAFSAVRVEPTWMALGEAAGWAAVDACCRGIAPAHVEVDALQRTLAGRGVMLTYFDGLELPADEKDVAAVAAQVFGTKGFFPQYEARLDEPLSPAVEACWRSGFARLRAGRLDARALAAEVARAEQDLTQQKSPCTRGEALVAWWQRSELVCGPTVRRRWRSC